jgi:hypothetical protein
VLAHSEEVAEQLRAGARVAERARIQRGGQTMLDGLQLLDVTVDLDENAASERSFSALIADPDGSLRPQLGTDALAPFGNELVYEIGVWRPSIADFEWSSAGVYRLSVTGGDTTRTLQLKGLDRSVVIARARNEVPYVILGGTPLAQAIYDYAAAKFPDVEFEADPDAWTTKISSTPKVYEEGDRTGDPWSNMRDLAAQYGRDLFFHASGRLVLQPIIDPAEAVTTWDYSAGDGNMATTGSTLMDSTGRANVAVVMAEGSAIDPPLRAIAEVTDPGSPLYPGTMGRVPIFLSSTMFTSAEQVADAAAALLQRQTGTADTVPFSAAANHLHEPRDVVLYGSELLDVRTRLVLSRWTLPGNLRGEVAYETRRVA